MFCAVSCMLCYQSDIAFYESQRHMPSLPTCLISLMLLTLAYRLEKACCMDSATSLTTRSTFFLVVARLGWMSCRTCSMARRVAVQTSLWNTFGQRYIAHTITIYLFVRQIEMSVIMFANNIVRGRRSCPFIIRNPNLACAHRAAVPAYTTVESRSAIAKKPMNSNTCVA